MQQPQYTPQPSKHIMSPTLHLPADQQLTDHNVHHSKRYNSKSTFMAASLSKKSLAISKNISNSQSFLQVLEAPKPNQSNFAGLPNLGELDHMIKGDSLLFHQRLHLIKSEMDEEIKLAGGVSRNHHRTNRNGVSIEHLEALRQKS